VRPSKSNKRFQRRCSLKKLLTDARTHARTDARTTDIEGSQKLTEHFVLRWAKKLMHIEFDRNYVELLICGKNRSLCYRNSICRIHRIDQSKTFTLLLKSKIIDFETLSRVHVYRIDRGMSEEAILPWNTENMTICRMLKAVLFY